MTEQSARCKPSLPDRHFEDFVAEVEPSLRRALVARFGTDRGREAVAESLAFAWVNWEKVRDLKNPVAYLFTVGRSRTQPPRRRLLLRAPENWSVPSPFEPALHAGLGQLTANQRTSVVLVVGFQWTYAEVAELLGVRRSTIQRHVDRGLSKLRLSLGEPISAKEKYE
jgi:DNA-directed RNA polymerase specialized sigma24 family protein